MVNIALVEYEESTRYVKRSLFLYSVLESLLTRHRLKNTPNRDDAAKRHVKINKMNRSGIHDIPHQKDQKELSNTAKIDLALFYFESYFTVQPPVCNFILIHFGC